MYFQFQPTYAPEYYPSNLVTLIKFFHLIFNHPELQNTDYIAGDTQCRCVRQICDGIISTTRTYDLNFYESSISTSRIHVFYFTNSCFLLHEFTYSVQFTNSKIMKVSCIQLHEFTISNPQIHDVNFMNIRFKPRGFTS